MMYVLIVLLVFVAALVAGNAFLSWLLAEPSEEQMERDQRPREPRSFYKPRTWIALRRLLARRPALLTYRRDKNGRFKKLNPGAGRKPSRASRPRSKPRPKSSQRRRRVHVPAE